MQDEIYITPDGLNGELVVSDNPIGDSSVAYVPSNTIATLTAERDELKQIVDSYEAFGGQNVYGALATAQRELAELRGAVVAWEQHDKARDDLSGAMESDPDYHDLIERVEQTHDRMTTLAAQLKEQDDER